ncbi:MAG: sugar phosphate isomerase/epimerase family protein [Hyphomicrobiaceae bacterium]
MPISLSLITDEVSPVLGEGLRMAAEEGLAKVDVRSIGGINFMSLDESAQRAVAREIRDAGLSVGTLATPLLKWPAPGRSADDVGDQFGFDMRGRTHDELYEDAFRCAEILGARDLRIFSLLTYDGFALDALDRDYGKLLHLAEQRDMTLHVENEPVCNISTVADLVPAMQRWAHPRLRALLDIPNAWRRRRPSEADLEAVTPFVSQLHFKDWSDAENRRVALGEGNIPFRRLLGPVYAAARERDVTFVVETHMPSEPAAGTLRSLRALKLLAA